MKRKRFGINSLKVEADVLHQPKHFLTLIEGSDQVEVLDIHAYVNVGEPGRQAPDFLRLRAQAERFTAFVQATDFVAYCLDGGVYLRFPEGPQEISPDLAFDMMSEETATHIVGLLQTHLGISYNPLQTP